MTAMRLLLVEDDARLASAVRSWMGHSGIGVDWVDAGAAVEAAMRREHYDCVVLDLGLPDMPGEDVLRRLRRTGFDVPVIVITAREQVADRVRLLDLGADDFVVKPIHLDELSARMRALLRRHGSPDNELRFAGIRVMSATRSVTRDGQHVPVTNKEFWLLETLMRNRDRVTPRKELEEALYGQGEEVGSNTVEVHVHHLRRKLGNETIQTVRGIGYALSSAS